MESGTRGAFSESRMKRAAFLQRIDLSERGVQKKMIWKHIHCRFLKADIKDLSLLRMHFDIPTIDVHNKRVQNGNAGNFQAVPAFFATSTS